MTATWRDLPGCTSCGRDPFVTVARGAACAPCLRNLCASAVTSWENWFAEVAPDCLKAAVLAPDDATTHADLAVTYSEMGLTVDALAEFVIAIASSGDATVDAGVYVLEHLSPLGWQRFYSGSVSGI